MITILIKRVETVFIRVSDIEKSSAWYKSVLQLDIKWGKEGMAAFKLGETDITIMQQELDITKDVTFNLLVNDIHSFRQHLKSLNINVSDIKTWEDLYYISFLDIDGNEIQAVERIQG